MSKSLFVSSLLLLTLALTGCQRQTATETAPSQVAQADSASQHQATGYPATLRERLPAETVFYLRLPSPLGLLLAPLGRAHDRVYSNTAQVAFVQRLRSALLSDPFLSPEALPQAALLHTLASPIEVAVVAPGRIPGPMAMVLVQMRTKCAGPEAFQNNLAGILTPAGLSWVGPFDDQGYAEIDSPTGRIHAHFDVQTGIATLLGGASAHRAALAAQVAAEAGEHALHELESEIDQSAAGLFLWFDIAAFKPLMAMGQPDPQQRALLQQLEGVQALAMGFGRVGDRGRVALRMRLDSPPWLDYVPRSARDFDLDTAGEPAWAISIALPTVSEFEGLRRAIGRDHGAQAAAQMAEFEQAIAAMTGVSITGLLQALGPELLVFNDDAGDFLAIRLADAAAFERLLEAAVAAGGQLRSVDSGTRHLALPNPFASAPDLDPNMQQLFGRLRSHYYWRVDGDYLVIALPQQLRDRAAARARGNLKQWLGTVHGDDNQARLLSIAGRSDHGIQRGYHQQLAMLQILANLLDFEPDLESLPSAAELGLPRGGSFGLDLSLDATRLGLSLNYELAPTDVLGSGNTMGIVAVTGIAAAIAIPAYQDYIERARVAEQLAGLAPLRLVLAEHYHSQGGFPGPEAADDLLSQVQVPEGTAIEPFTGAILMPIQVGGQDYQLILAPRKVGTPDGGWVCLGELPAKYLPASCRP